MSIAIFRAAVTVILALTKCSPNGKWIQSMFQASNDRDLSNQGGDYTTVALFSNETDGSKWQDWIMQLDRNNLVNVEVEAEGFARNASGADFGIPW